MRLLFSTSYWLYFGATAIVLYMGALGICAVTAPFDFSRRLLHRYTCWWSRLYLHCLPGCKVVVEGREKILSGGPYVFVANHQSLTDIMALAFLRVPFKWVSKKEAFWLPCIGWNMYLNNYIKVDRGNMRTVVQTMKLCRQWLDRGVSVMMFPEGSRQPSGEIAKFHGGSFKLAVDAGCTVAPIVVDGTLPIYRNYYVLARPGQITIRVLDPIPIAEAGGKANRLREIAYERMKKALADTRRQKQSNSGMPTAEQAGVGIPRQTPAASCVSRFLES